LRLQSVTKGSDENVSSSPNKSAIAVVLKVQQSDDEKAVNELVAQISCISANRTRKAEWTEACRTANNRIITISKRVSLPRAMIQCFRKILNT